MVKRLYGGFKEGRHEGLKRATTRRVCPYGKYNPLTPN